MMNDQEAMDFISKGELEHLQTLADMYEDFTHGQDSFCQRAWITNAIDCGTYEVVEWMLAQKVSLHFCSAAGYTPLHSALDRENADKYRVLELLCSAGADVNAYGGNCDTPLHLAAVRNDVEALRILLAHGADPRLETTDHHMTPLEVAAAVKARDALKFLEQFT